MTPGHVTEALQQLKTGCIAVAYTDLTANSFSSHLQSVHTTSCCATPVLRPNYVLVTMVYIFVIYHSCTITHHNSVNISEARACTETEIRLIIKDYHHSTITVSQ